MSRTTRFLGGITLMLLAMPGHARAPGVVAPAAPSPPHAIARLEPGLWELQGPAAANSDGGAPRRLCISDLRQLLQPLHVMPLCRHFVADEGPDHVNISYDCAGRGQGRTALRVETSRLIQVESSGIAEGRPFAARLEGRRLASCAAKVAASH